MRSIGFALLIFFICGCRTEYREDLDYSYAVEQSWQIEELNFGEIVQFESVQWHPDDSHKLRTLIVDDKIAAGRDVLELGTGTGLVSVVCLQNDADMVVAIDTNPAAVACAKYNAATLVPESKLDVRLAWSSSGDFDAVEAGEKFDLVLATVEVSDDFTHSLAEHLNPGGKCLLLTKSLATVARLKGLQSEDGFAVVLLDDRPMESLVDPILPGILIEIKPPLK